MYMFVPQNLDNIIYLYYNNTRSQRASINLNFEEQKEQDQRPTEEAGFLGLLFSYHSHSKKYHLFFLIEVDVVSMKFDETFFYFRLPKY